MRKADARNLEVLAAIVQNAAREKDRVDGRAALAVLRLNLIELNRRIAEEEEFEKPLADWGRS